MPIQFVGKLLTAASFALGVLVAPALAVVLAPAVAHAEGEGGVPEPGPVPEPPRPQVQGGTGGCQAGETLDPANGNCVPAMTALPATQGGRPIEELQPRTTQDITSTTTSGVGADLVPNINGYPCTGYWMSMACVETSGDEVPVQPKTTISSSP